MYNVRLNFFYTDTPTQIMIKHVLKNVGAHGAAGDETIFLSLCLSEHFYNRETNKNRSPNVCSMYRVFHHHLDLSLIFYGTADLIYFFLSYYFKNMNFYYFH